MGVYIKDMEMPKNCTECKIKGEGSDSLYTWSCPFTGFEYTRYDCLNDRLDDCPLIEVTNPHGRLIDASTRITVATQRGFGLRVVTVDTLIDEYAVRNVPTIIEAEGSE